MRFKSAILFFTWQPFAFPFFILTGEKAARDHAGKARAEGAPFEAGKRAKEGKRGPQGSLKQPTRTYYALVYNSFVFSYVVLVSTRGPC